MQTSERQAHWEGVYSAKTPGEVSWFQARPDISLDLIDRAGTLFGDSIVDVGGGASNLVDNLLAAGRTSIIVLDISAAAFTHARSRLGARANDVSWIVADVMQWRPSNRVAIWHDRAVLHFLTEAADQQQYAARLREALAPTGWAIIAGFAPGGPTKCSGLDVVQHDSDSLARLLGNGFELVETRDEIHRTPWQAEQAFRYHLFRRRA